MNIRGLQKLTLLDYPGHMSCTIFVGGCNFRCHYCHNSALVLHPETEPAISEEELFSFLESRKGRLEAVCITGGEPTLQPDLIHFITRVRDMGFKVKLDTNGQNPQVLQVLLDAELVDYVAMDVKNCKELYGKTIGVPGFSTEQVEASVELLKACQIPYEFRTTVTAELHNDASMKALGEWLSGARNFFLQPYRDSEQVLRPGLFHAPDTNTLLRYRKLLSPYVAKVTIRGLE